MNALEMSERVEKLKLNYEKLENEYVDALEKFKTLHIDSQALGYIQTGMYFQSVMNQGSLKVRSCFEELLRHWQKIVSEKEKGKPNEKVFFYQGPKSHNLQHKTGGCSTDAPKDEPATGSEALKTNVKESVDSDDIVLIQTVNTNVERSEVEYLDADTKICGSLVRKRARSEALPRERASKCFKNLSDVQTDLNSSKRKKGTQSYYDVSEELYREWAKEEGKSKVFMSVVMDKKFFEDIMDPDILLSSNHVHACLALLRENFDWYPDAVFPTFAILDDHFSQLMLKHLEMFGTSSQQKCQWDPKLLDYFYGKLPNGSRAWFQLDQLYIPVYVRDLQWVAVRVDLN
ncbi:hypothetical protein OWV82_015968 [Melia azedarach]|uniref:Uncharacterized protein n=1 Tax=Melia azedarach TaxID=155640 RepID=A0ACC1XRZ3_MELAZ|nr:hypothetical protein OWV82_015968 [Melia azedarach]